MDADASKQAILVCFSNHLRIVIISTEQMHFPHVSFRLILSFVLLGQSKSCPNGWIVCRWMYVMWSRMRRKRQVSFSKYIIHYFINSGSFYIFFLCRALCCFLLFYEAGIWVTIKLEGVYHPTCLSPSEICMFWLQSLYFICRVYFVS